MWVGLGLTAARLSHYYRPWPCRLCRCTPEPPRRQATCSKWPALLHLRPRRESPSSKWPSRLSAGLRAPPESHWPAIALVCLHNRTVPPRPCIRLVNQPLPRASHAESPLLLALTCRGEPPASCGRAHLRLVGHLHSEPTVTPFQMEKFVIFR